MDTRRYVYSIKKIAENEIITKEEYAFRLNEIAKCKRDIIYFANTYFKILTMDKGIVQIKLYKKQEELLKFFKDENRCIVLSARQSGKSSMYTIYLLWLCCFFPEKRAMILANKAATAIEIMSRIQMGYERLPNWLKPRVIVWNKGQIMFANKSEIRGFASSSDAARGFSANVICLDEFAFLPKNIADKLFTSIYPVVSSAKNGKIIIVSTPNGTVENLYYDLWQQANGMNNNEGWKPFEMHWWDVPGRDEKFKESTIASIGERRWAQEFACEFLSDAENRKLIPDDIIEKFKKRIEQYKADNILDGKTVQIVSQNQEKVFNAKVWKPFDQTRTYLASADVAEGTGNDSSVLNIWDVTDLSNIEQVAKFSDNNVSVVEFAFICNKMCEAYANPVFIVENNAVGSGLIDMLRMTYGYSNIVREGNKNNPYGIRSHSSIKPKACMWVRDMFTTAGFDWVIKDYSLIKEMETFVKKETLGKTSNTTYQALQNAHDDQIVTLIWAAYLLQPDLIDRYFVVVETFMSSLGIIYPKTLAPGVEYTNEEISKAQNSRIFREYMNEKILDEIKDENQKEKQATFNKRMLDKDFGMEYFEPAVDRFDKSNVNGGYFIDGDGTWDDFDGPSW